MMERGHKLMLLGEEAPVVIDLMVRDEENKTNLPLSVVCEQE
jgi:hypothetical protein